MADDDDVGTNHDQAADDILIVDLVIGRVKVCVDYAELYLVFEEIELW